MTGLPSIVAMTFAGSGAAGLAASAAGGAAGCPAGAVSCAAADAVRAANRLNGSASLANAARRDENDMELSDRGI